MLVRLPIGPLEGVKFGGSVLGSAKVLVIGVSFHQDQATSMV